MKKIQLYTDGACSGNPGRGGYGAVLKYNGSEKELSRGFRLTTNNRMELLAAIAGLEALKERRAQAEGKVRSLGDPLVLESDMARQRERLAGLREQQEALSLALETLAEADTELQSRFSPKLSQKAAEYFAFLTAGRYDEVTIAKDLSAKVRKSGDSVGHETDYLSEGATDQLYLALRLAVCELALEGAECPMVLDDALVNFDELRMERAMELIRKIAESRQVLLFTCHDREYKYLMDDPGVAVVPIGEGKAEAL